ncbi:MAG: CapA family protein, partial [Candidatus Atribacteria bacterium]|nr:CapA family protein [Candidatus Atribacteria bacterium]
NLPGPSQSHLDDLVFEIQQVRKSVDFIIVSFHWGLEYSPLPSLHQIEYAHGCIDAGADLVIGHHPHVIQSIEKYRGKIILYSVGNFVFDQPPGMGSDTFLFGCTFARGGIHSPHLLPVVIVRCRPELATGEDFKRIAREVQFVSEKYHVVFHQGKDRLEIADEE